MDLFLFKSSHLGKDLYKHLISYLAGGLFGVPELLHVFGGFVLGFFFTKSALLVLEDKKPGKWNYLLIGFVALFLLSRSITALNSLRMWTALWLFFFGAAAYVKKRKVKYLFVTLGAVFVHFSYLLYLLPLVGGYLLKGRRLILAGIYVLSFFTSIGFQQLSSAVESTGVAEGSTDVNILDEDDRIRKENQRSRASSSNFYKQYGATLYFGFTMVVLSFILLTIDTNYYTKPKYLDFLISAGIVISSFSNLLQVTSPSAAGRGLMIASVFLTAAIIQVLLKKENYLPLSLRGQLMHIGLYVAILSSFPYMLLQLSYIYNTVSVFIFIMPLFSSFFGFGDMSIADFIRFFI